MWVDNRLPTAVLGMNDSASGGGGREKGSGERK